MRVIMTGGGTGGHIYPAIAIAEKLMQEDKRTKCLYIGAKRGIEKDIVPNSGIPFKQIDVAPLNKKISFKIISSLFQVMKGHIQAYRYIKAFNPDVIVGTGGYVTGPVVLVGALMGIPCTIHEQNAFPGMANKILSRFVSSVMVTFEDASDYFKTKDKIVFTGLPIREAFFKVSREEARRKLSLKDSDIMIMTVGGSNGALKVNEVMSEVYEKISTMENVVFTHVSGERYYDALKERFSTKVGKKLRLLKYVDDMPIYLSAADIVVSRAGASTITEIIASKTPSIIIPSPNVANNHQFHNAKVIDKHGMGFVISESDLNSDLVVHTLTDLIEHPEKLNIMANNCEKMNAEQTLTRISQNIHHIVKG